MEYLTRFYHGRMREARVKKWRLIFLEMLCWIFVFVALFLPSVVPFRVLPIFAPGLYLVILLTPFFVFSWAVKLLHAVSGEKIDD